MLPSPYVFVMEEIAASNPAVLALEDFPPAEERESAAPLLLVGFFSRLFSGDFSIDLSVDLGGIKMVMVG